MSADDLTPRQLDVARLVAEGWTNKQIAWRLGMSERRLRVHVTALAFSLGLDEGKDVRVQIALWWRLERPAAA